MGNKLQKLAQEYAALEAQLAELERRRVLLRDDILESGESEIDGGSFLIRVIKADREQIDWKAIAKKLGPSRQLVAAYSRIRQIHSVRVEPKLVL